jgi:O-antigen/teichoic acid export membrane protein
MVARAAVGPVERLLNTLSERKQCALIYAGAFAINLVRRVILIPRIAIEGAALAASSALVAESIQPRVAAKRQLGFHLFILGGGQT